MLSLKVLPAAVMRAQDTVRARSLFASPRAAARFFRRAGSDEPLDLRHQGVRFVARPSDWVAVREILLEGEYDPVAPLLTRQTTRVLDLGANIGCFSLFASLLAPTAEVVCVEPARDTFELLMRNRDLTGKRWHPVHGAAWSTAGSIVLGRATSSTGHGVGRSGSGEEVPTFTLRQLLSGRPVDLVKMDIEGAEGEVLASDPDVLRHVKHLVVEIHPQLTEPRPVLDVLRDRFGHVYSLHNRGSDKPLLVCTDERLELPRF